MSPPQNSSSARLPPKHPRCLAFFAHSASSTIVNIMLRSAIACLVLLFLFGMASATTESIPLGHLTFLEIDRDVFSPAAEGSEANGVRRGRNNRQRELRKLSFRVTRKGESSTCRCNVSSKEKCKRCGGKCCHKLGNGTRSCRKGVRKVCKRYF